MRWAPRHPCRTAAFLPFFELERERGLGVRYCHPRPSLESLDLDYIEMTMQCSSPFSWRIFKASSLFDGRQTLAGRLFIASPRPWNSQSDYP
jgi:hypothetical protein